MHVSQIAAFVVLAVGIMCRTEPHTGTGFIRTCNDLKITTDSGKISLVAACLDGKSQVRQKSTLDLNRCFEYSDKNLKAKKDGDFKGYFDVRNIKLDCHVDRFNIRRYNSPALACKYVFKNMLDTVYTEKELDATISNQFGVLDCYGYRGETE